MEKINILLIGAGKGGKSLIEMFEGDEIVNIIGIVDKDSNAPGIKLAKKLKIPTDTSWYNFLNSNDLNEIIDVTGDKKVFQKLISEKPLNVNLMDGYSAKLMWLLIDEHTRIENTLKEAQEELLQASKLSIMGQMAAEMAHEINNPLGTCKIYLEDLLSDIKDNIVDKNNIDQTLKILLKNIDKIAASIRRMLTFSKSEEQFLSTFDLNELLSSSVNDFKTSFNKLSIVVEENYSNSKIEITGNRDSLSNLFTNLLLNAKDAIIAGNNKKRAINIVTNISNDAYANIEISDSGIGINKSDYKKIFQPFFTTKKENGSGLGLAISSKVIEEHNGTIEVESEFKKGTKFTIKLPLDKA